jgi:hypothetical protein
VEHATFFVFHAVDGNHDVVDRELVGRPCQAVAAARPGLRLEYSRADERRERLREYGGRRVGRPRDYVSGHECAVRASGDLERGSKAIVGGAGKPKSH